MSTKQSDLNKITKVSELVEIAVREYMTENGKKIRLELEEKGIKSADMETAMKTYEQNLRKLLQQKATQDVAQIKRGKKPQKP